ncbi:MAG TPA: valine--tRNA ligase, partial [Candidatus Limnocylindria bacterium]|nr:valine--tRNA ligase [Candidatus Limnocylindria bacterium]
PIHFEKVFAHWMENIKHDEAGTLWTIRYHLADADGRPDPGRWISVATTRPETIFGDTAVAVHPEDERYADLVGREAILPFLGRRLPIIADEHVERDFGTGAVKITPAHDFDDYEVGRRHGLPMISILDEDARLNEQAGEFAGQDRYDARAAVLERLRQMGDLEGEAPHQMVIGRCDRCGTVVEPRLSVQWFVNVKPLAERALASVREGRTRIVPIHFEKVFAHWMENIHDWAVGRQLWWGHRIPAWYCPDGHITVSDAADGPSACAECGRPATELTQETDIFDTWFSSGLWPFSTLGWPEQTPDLQRFYPTQVMETAYEILFFWVARMMMLGLFLTDVEPFETVYLHGIVRDPYGQKMSKTKGNVVDPLQMVDEIGADALRFALTIGTSPGHDQSLTQPKLDGARNFANKLWNVARFVLGAQPATEAAPGGDPALPERWIRSRLAAVVERSTMQLEALDLAGYAATVQEFTWSDFADWFVEMAKIELRRDDATEAERARVWRTLVDTLADLLRLLHPLMPFITEEIWATLAAVAPEATRGDELLMTAAWPAAGVRDADAEAEMDDLMALIRDLRNLRSEGAVAAGRWVEATLAPRDERAAAVAERGRTFLQPMARVRPFTVSAEADRPELVSTTPLGAAWLNVDAAETAERRTRQAAELQAGIDRLEALLANDGFVERAPGAVVDKERRRLAELRAQLQQLRD